MNAFRPDDLTETPGAPAFGRVTQLASRLLETPAALVSLVDDCQQFIHSTVGSPGFPARDCAKPPSYSFCRHVVESGAPVIIADVRYDKRLRHESEFHDATIVSYLGVPLVNPEGNLLGSFCVFDKRSRQWTPGQVGLVSELAQSVLTEIELRARIAELRRSLARYESLDTQTPEQREQLETKARHSEKLSTLGQLLSGVTHDLNNLITVILSESELIKMGGLSPEELTEAVGEIYAAAQRGSGLVRQMLAFARKQPPRWETLELSAAVRNITKLLGRLLGENIRMTLQLAREPLLIHADANMLDQVIMNLVVNSRDAMPGGGDLVIAVEPAESSQPGQSHGRTGPVARLVVRDTGCGIPTEVLPRIFAPFFTTKEVSKGTGLGLSTVQAIVKQHRGWIEIESRPGQGTEVRVSFPLAH